MMVILIHKHFVKITKEIFFVTLGADNNIKVHDLDIYKVGQKKN